MRISHIIGSIRDGSMRGWRWLREDSLDHAKKIWREFNKDNGFLLAAAMSFYTFLSVFPLVLVGIAIFGYILGSPENARQLVLGTASHYAVGSSAIAILESIAGGSGTGLGLGTLLLLWSGSTLMVMVQQAMNVVWDLEQPRGMVKQRLVGLLFLALLGTLLLLSLGATTAINAISSSNILLIPGWSWVASLFSYFIPLVMSIAAFTLLYKLMPNTSVRWKVALIGGVFAGVFWEIAKVAFTFYVVNFGSYRDLYGSLGGVILFLIWVDYSAIILILGGELAAVWARDHRQPGYADAKRENGEQEFREQDEEPDNDDNQDDHSKSD